MLSGGNIAEAYAINPKKGEVTLGGDGIYQGEQNICRSGNLHMWIRKAQDGTLGHPYGPITYYKAGVIKPNSINSLQTICLRDKVTLQRILRDETVDISM